MKKRYVIVGASFRCYILFACNMVDNLGDKTEVVGIYDPNKTRCKYFQKKIGDGLTIYDDFDTMLDTEKPDAVLVTTSDLYHHEYIVRALDKGYDVISEKPITNTYERCLAIREAEKRSGKKVSVTFNMRFDPAFVGIKELIAQGKIGKVHNIAYTHYLDRNHGADYFRRWHRYMKNSEGLLLHKSTHHFDIINWFLEEQPKFVTALGNRVYFGNKDRFFADCCRNCSDVNCECYGNSQTSEQDIDMYFNAEHEDGYVRDTCCFKPDTDIYDNMSVSVMYDSGTILAYTLNCFSMYEGCRIRIVGEKGDLEFARGITEDDRKDTHYTIRIDYKDGNYEVVRIKKLTGSHAGSDLRLAKMLLAGEGVESDTLGQCADCYAGFTSAMIGIAANESIKTFKTIDLTEQLDTLK